MSKVAIVNSSPTILLSKIGRLEFLQLLSKKVILPQSVWEEISRYSVKSEIPDLGKFPWLSIRPDPEIPTSIVEWNLGKGESAVLAMGLVPSESEVVLDDLDARMCAQEHDLKVIGTMGVVILARERKLIQAAKPIFMELRKAGMFLSDKTMNEILAKIGEFP